MKRLHLAALRRLLTVALVTASAAFAQAQTVPPKLIAPGVWFLLGDASNGYCNNIVIEMADYLIIVDANYPARARELVLGVKQLSPKPVRYVIDTHGHRDHAYGNSIWTATGATTLAYRGVLDEMNRYEPERWRETAALRPDVAELNLTTAPRPMRTYSHSPYILRDGTREVQLLYFGWAHTRGDTLIWLPRERILCTGDVAVNGPRNKLADGNLANWPRVLARAEALHAESVLPGHGDAGGPEILSGQRGFLLDLYAAVKQQASVGKTPTTMQIQLPERDANWVPKSLEQDVEVTYTEITQGQPAGAVPHVWR